MSFQVHFGCLLTIAPRRKEEFIAKTCKSFDIVSAALYHILELCLCVGYVTSRCHDNNNNNNIIIIIIIYHLTLKPAWTGRT